MSNAAFSRKQVGKLLGISDRTIWFYTEEGIVTPEIANPKGKGTTRLYSPKNVMEIAVARKLAEHGLKLELVRDVLRAPRLLRSRDAFDPWNPTQGIETAGGRYFLIISDPGSEKPGLVVTYTRGGRPLQLTGKPWGASGTETFEVCIVVDLTAIRERVQQMLA